jgi:hypothetical protein
LNMISSAPAASQVCLNGSSCDFVSSITMIDKVTLGFERPSCFLKSRTPPHVFADSLESEGRDP